MIMLIDNVLITVKGGDGGNGASTFLHTSVNFKGGPNGGNGGNGGSVYLQGSTDLTALQQFQFKKEWKAQNGVDGKNKNLFGRTGEDLVIFVPLGTSVTDIDKNKTYEIDNIEDKLLIAKGGIGGRGNTEFKSSTNQAPHYAEPGTKGSVKNLKLELRLIADIGFIGLPNAGKSSLLSVLTNAKPKIANYPFTTLEPNLGVMDGIILADIPGLIEGASQGRGLGFKFLKHIEKTRVLVHCLDCSEDDLVNNYLAVHDEFEKYGNEINQKQEIILLTKIDLITKEELNIKEEKLKNLQKKIYKISIYDNDSINDIKKILINLIKK